MTRWSMTRWSMALVLLVMGALAGALATSSYLQGQPTTTTGIPKELASYRDIVKQVLPAVVSVESRFKPMANKNKQQNPSRVRPRIEDFPGLPEEFRKFFEEGEDFGLETPNPIPQHAFGSGFIIDSKGIVLTNYHVVAGADSVKIELKDGRTFQSKDIQGDRKNDLAIVRIKTSEALPQLEWGNSDAMEIGDRVLAVGAPFGLTGSVTAGIVSGKGRSGVNTDKVVYEDYLQTDAAINPGNSGGPLVNLEGKVIGINTAIKSRTGGFQGVGLAITSTLAKDIVHQLIEHGVVHRGYLGVVVMPLQPEVAAQLGMKGETGVVVSKVLPGTPASKAGIKAGDVITSVGGKPIKDGRELQRLVGSLPLRKPVNVALVRDDKTETHAVTIEDQPDNFGERARERYASRPSEPEGDEVSVDKIGMDVSDLTPDLAKRYGYKDETQGVVITDVQPGSLASEAGLDRGMLILKIGKKLVTTAAATRDTLQKANLEKGVLLQVQYAKNGGGTAYVVLKAEAAGK